VERALGQVDLTEVGHRRIAHLSRGYRQRVALADALVSDPPLLILDEPTAGLDPNQIRQVRRLIRELGDSRTVLLSTHVLSEVESTCQRAIVIHHGQVAAEGNLEELKAQRRSRTAVFRLSGEPEQARQVLNATDGVERALDGGDPDATARDPSHPFKVIAEFNDRVEDMDAAVERLVARLVSAGVGVREASLAKASLEDVFAELTLARFAPPPAAEDEE
jgi:ABC-2 type transport system ATP-binding protein